MTSVEPVHIDLALFDVRLQGFLQAAQAKVTAYYTFHYAKSQVPVLELERGPKYVRIVRAEYHEGKRTHAGAYCFVNSQNGDVLKASSWKAPEKKNPRSNVYDTDYGVSGVSAYGANYLR